MGTTSHDMKLWAFGRDDTFEDFESGWEMGDVLAGRGGSDGAFRHRDVDAKADEGLEKSNMCEALNLTVGSFPF
jgi:hypothetical protein